jgi:hypothetical protein
MVPAGKTQNSSSSSNSSTPRNSRRSSKILAEPDRDAQKAGTRASPNLNPRERIRSTTEVHRSRAVASDASANHGIAAQYQPTSSSQKLSATNSRAQRPPLSIRAQSYPTVPAGIAPSANSTAASNGRNGQDLQSPIEGHETEQSTSEEESGEDEITQDPFFKDMFHRPGQVQDDEADEEEAISVPSKTQPQPERQTSPINTTLAPNRDKGSRKASLGSPHGPLSPQYVRFCR